MKITPSSWKKWPNAWGVAASTLSRIETGKAPTKSVYLTAMLEMYGVTDPSQRQVLVDMAREGHRKGWWSVYDDVLPTGFGIYVGLEAEAAGVRSFEGEVIHGLFQTPDYARAILREVQVKDSDEQIERLVDLRIKRQDSLERTPPLDVWLILDESVVRRTIGGPDVMRGQLARLVEASRKPNVTLQVLPFASGSHAGLRGSFSILEFPERADSDVAYVESVASHHLPRERAGSEALRGGLRPAPRGRSLAGPVHRPDRRSRQGTGLIRRFFATSYFPPGFHNTRKKGRMETDLTGCAGSRAAQAAPADAWKSLICPTAGWRSVTPRTAARRRTCSTRTSGSAS